MQDSWQSGDPYDYYMGRWSSLVAGEFVDWLSAPSGLRWLDVGCGSGALSQAIASRQHPASIVAIDQSEGFVRATQQRLGSQVRCKVGNALSLPLDDATMDVAVSGLVLNFIPQSEKALSEMRRVTRAGGTVAVYVWDYAGTMEFLRHFWDVAVALNPAASALHEAHRFPDTRAEKLVESFEHAGFSEIESTPIDIVTRFTDFDDYWKPFLGGQGPAPTFVAKLGDTERNRLRDSLARRLPVHTDGSISLQARAWATKGTV